MKLAEKRSRSQEKFIVNLQGGRPLLLGNDIDEKVRKYIMTLRYKEGQGPFSIAIAVAKALIEQGDNESLKVLKFGKDWASFGRIGFKKRAATTGKGGCTERSRIGLPVRYCKKIETYNIPHQLVFNMDQTPSKHIQSSRYTMEKSARKSVAIAGSRDKRAITATFIIDLAGNFLPMQLIYGGKTDRSLLKVDFPKGFSLSANPKRYSNKKVTQKIIDEIILPRAKYVREELKLSSNFPALSVMDVFRGQITKAVRNLLKDNNIFISLVPNNTTHIF